MKRMGWLLITLAFLSGAQESLAMGLETAARLALEHAPAHAAAIAARDAAHEDEALGRAWLLPYVRGRGEFTHFEQKYAYDRNPGFLKHDVTFNHFLLGVELVQPLFRLDRWAGYAQGKLAARVGELKLKMERQSLLLAVAQAYAEVMVARDNLAAIQAHEQAVSRLRARMQAAFEVGTATINDALEAKSRLDATRAMLIRARNELDLARERLASLVGRGEVEVEHFAPRFSSLLKDVTPADAETWRELGMERSLAVRMARLQLEVARQEVKRSLGQALPGVDLVAGLSRDRETDNLFGTGYLLRTEELGVRMEVPLYAGGGTWAQLRKARKLQVEAEYNLKEEERKAGLAAVRAWRNLSAALARVKASRIALDSARKARKAARIGYAAGLRTVVELLDAEDRLAAARVRLVQARADAMLQRLALRASIGEMDMRAIRKADALLEGS